MKQNNYTTPWCFTRSPPPWKENDRRGRIADMAKDTKTVLDRVLTWPPERQEDAVRMLTAMEEQDHSTLRLSDEQAAEVRRRLNEKNPKVLTHAEFNKRIRDRYGV